MFQQATETFKKRKESFFKKRSKPNLDAKPKYNASNAPHTSKKISWSNKGFSDHPKLEQDTDTDSSDGDFVDHGKTPNKENVNPDQAPGAPSLKRQTPGSVLASMNKRKAARYESDLVDTFGPVPQHSQSPEWERQILAQDEKEAKKEAPQKSVKFSKEQLAVLQAAQGGESLFFTGAAGTGKSVVLQEIIQMMRESHGMEAVAVCATTGLAATNIGGGTLHRWAGVGLGLEDAPALIKMVKKSNDKRANWLRTRVLIIDEVSMLEASFLDKLNEIGKAVFANYEQGFGGIQVILTGDFYQLPPVSKSGNQPYCFKAKCWNDLIRQQFNLTEVFRQKGDDQLIRMLNSLRVGNMEYVESFKQLARPIQTHNDIEPSRLYPTRQEVAISNKDRLSKLKGYEKVYAARDEFMTHNLGRNPEDGKNKLDNAFLISRELPLRRNALVMYVKNNPDMNLVNGDKGIVLGFATPAIYSELCQEEKKGNRDVVDLYCRLFDYNGFGGDLHAVKKETGNTPSLQAMAKIRGRMLKSRDDFEKMGYPILRMSDNRRILAKPADFELRDEHNKPQARRVQMPLIHAWALSIHKSQGQTLDSVIVDLGRAFEKGQAYVALSRATNADGLQVLNFSMDKVKVSEEVKQFYAGFGY